MKKRVFVLVLFVLLFAFSLCACLPGSAPGREDAAAIGFIRAGGGAGEVPAFGLAAVSDFIYDDAGGRQTAGYRKEALLPLSGTASRYMALDAALAELNAAYETRVDEAFAEFSSLVSEDPAAAPTGGYTAESAFYLQRADAAALSVLASFRRVDVSGEDRSLSSFVCDCESGKAIALSSLVSEEAGFLQAVAEQTGCSALPEIGELLWSLDTNGIHVWVPDDHGEYRTAHFFAGNPLLKESDYFTCAPQGRRVCPGLGYVLPPVGEEKAGACSAAEHGADAYLLFTENGSFLYEDAGETLSAAALKGKKTPIDGFPALRLDRRLLPWGERAVESVLQPVDPAAIPVQRTFAAPVLGSVLCGAAVPLLENGAPDTAAVSLWLCSGADAARIVSRADVQFPIVTAEDPAASSGKVQLQPGDVLTLYGIAEKEQVMLFATADATLISLPLSGGDPALTELFEIYG